MLERWTCNAGSSQETRNAKATQRAGNPLANQSISHMHRSSTACQLYFCSFACLFGVAQRGMAHWHDWRSAMVVATLWYKRQLYCVFTGKRSFTTAYIYAAAPEDQVAS